MDRRALVLNATFEPISVVPVQRAVVLVILGRADVVEAAADQFRAAAAAFDVPLVVRLRKYVKVPFRKTAPLTRRALFARDGYRCAYCRAHKSHGQLTWDHVIPRAQGGKHRWENVVAACEPCNHRKADQTPAEAGMPCMVKPYAPSGAMALVVLVGRIDPVWESYLGLDAA